MISIYMLMEMTCSYRSLHPSNIANEVNLKFSWTNASQYLIWETREARNIASSLLMYGKPPTRAIGYRGCCLPKFDFGDIGRSWKHASLPWHFPRLQILCFPKLLYFCSQWWIERLNMWTLIWMKVVMVAQVNFIGPNSGLQLYLLK